jgi:hypothetical protein
MTLSSAVGGAVTSPSTAVLAASQPPPPPHPTSLVFSAASSPGAVTDVAITIESAPQQQRPLHDGPSQASFGFNLDPPSRISALMVDGFAPVGGDLNSGVGGALVRLWLRRRAGRAAVTDLRLALSADEDALLAGGGWEIVSSRLNEQSAAGGRVSLWLRRGVGAPIVDVGIFGPAAPPSPWVAVAGNANSPLASAAVFLGVRYRRVILFLALTHLQR